MVLVHAAYRTACIATHEQIILLLLSHLAVLGVMHHLFVLALLIARFQLGQHLLGRFVGVPHWRVDF